MITKVVYNNKSFSIIDEYGFKFSNNEVTFNDIKIDFTGCTIADIPFKYQEIKIVQSENEENILNGEVIFTGFLDTIQLSDMKLIDEDREITLTLLSPLALATKRNVSLIGTYDLKIAIKRVLQPLIDDGFIVKELNVPEGQITTNYILESVEYEMNDIGYKRNIFWYINEKKEIFVNSIDYLFGLPISKVIDENIQEKGLYKIEPSIANVDYANVINLKNIRLIYSEKDNNIENQDIGFNIYPILNLTKTIKNGDIINFDNPLIIDENTLKQVIEEQKQNNTYYNILLNITTSNNEYKTYQMKIEYDNNEYGVYTKVGSITFSDEKGNEGEVVLQRDSFFSNLITGFKWNGGNATITEIRSDTALRYTSMRFMYSAEINKLKGVISNSGQIEKTVDYNEKWTTLQQLIDYARSLMIQNSNNVNQIILAFDVNPNLSIGDLVKINAPNFLIEGTFAVKDINYTYNNENDQNWEITLKNTDLISSYIDMFRPQENQENQEHIDTVILSEFIEEQVNEVHEIEVENED